MKNNCKISDYLRGRLTGEEANALEREALSDVFLYEALEGYDLIEGQHTAKIDACCRNVRKHTSPRKLFGTKVWSGIVVLFVLGGLVTWRINKGDVFQKDETTTVENVKSETSPVIVYKSTKEQNVVDSQALAEGNGYEVVATSFDNNRVMSGEPISMANMEPFEQYVRDSMRYPEDARLEGLKGEVELTFRVNDVGCPSNVLIVRGLSASCNQEAIRLLTEGPLWAIHNDDERLTIVMNFPAR